MAPMRRSGSGSNRASTSGTTTSSRSESRNKPEDAGPAARRVRCRAADERSNMDDLRSTAQLVDFDPVFAAGGSIGTVLSRAEIAEAAARDEFPATLLLDLDRVEAADGGEVMAHAKLALDWDKSSLERLLA